MVHLKMSNDEMELLKKRRLLEMQRRALMKSFEEAKSKESSKKKEENPEQALRKLFEGRATEVYNTAKMQFPEVTKKITKVLAELISKGELTGPISGEELFWLFRRLSANVRLETHIKFVESGKTKTIADKMRGE
jgi:DNA-binding TFAR19-related protein (PDSD5 family)